MVMTTLDRHGEPLQTVQPDRTLTAGPLQLQAGIPLSPNTLLNGGAVYLFCKSIIHVRFSREGDAADAWSAPIDARGGAVLACVPGERISVLLAEGEGENLVWICGVR